MYRVSACLCRTDQLAEAVGRDNVFPVGSVLKPEVGTLLRLTG